MTSFLRNVVFPCLLLVAALGLQAQAPQQLNYQAVVRDASGNPLAAGTIVSLKLQIHNGSPSGAIVYTETESVTTNQFGLITYAIGYNGNLATVNWGNGAKYLQVLIDETGGSNFTDMGTTQLLSVPYALYAGNSASGNGATGASGPTGANGLPGTDGATGATGATGLTGLRGAAGATGATGSIGAQGIQGVTGVQGLQGATGNDGAQGIQGVTGAQGIPGIQGVTGNDGAQGVQGITGAQGIQGATGNDGAQGPTGAMGATGNDGAQGVQGITGAQGIQGLTGNDGAQGIQGATGNDGGQGPTGAMGAAGNDGAQGIQGITGAQGIQGVTGNDGAQGVQGITGAQGIQGLTGNDGAQGIQGATGNDGVQGPAGAQGATGLLPDGSTAGNTPYWDGTQWVTNSSNLYNNGGNVGIGNANPLYTLDVNGNMHASGAGAVDGQFTIGGNAFVGGNLNVVDSATGITASPGDSSSLFATTAFVTNAIDNSVANTSSNYIANGTTQQNNANFNIGGNGTVGGQTTTGSLVVNGSANGVTPPTSDSSTQFATTAFVKSAMDSLGIQQGTQLGNTMFWNGTTWVTNSSNIYNDGTNVAAQGGTATGTSVAIGQGSTANSNSVAIGTGNTASGQYSTSMGNGSTASGYTATTMGSGNVASGTNSLATGARDTASGWGSFSQGANNNASGSYAVTLGNNNVASLDGAMVTGTFSVASGYYSLAMGLRDTASGNYSTAIGTQVSTNGYQGSVIMGDYSGPADNTAANQFMGHFTGGYVWASDYSSTAANSMVYNNGQLGIGTLTPTAQIDATGTLRFENYTNGLLTVDGSGNLGVTTGGTLLGNGTALGNTMYWNGTQWVLNSNQIYNNGTNIGIGNTNPTHTLDVLNGQVYLDLQDNYGGLHVQGVNGTEASIALEPDNVSPGSAGQWILYTNGAQLNNLQDFAIFNSGLGGPAFFLQASSSNVGIGNSNPQAQLDVANTVRFDNYTNGILTVDGAGNLGVGSGSSLFTAGTGLAWNGTTLNSNWNLNGNYLFNNNGGNVGINTNNPGSQLTIAADGNEQNNAQLAIEGATSNGQQLLLGYNTNNNYSFLQSVYQDINYEPLILNPISGNVGIANNNPQATLDVNGTVRFDNYNNGLLTVDGSGNLGVTNGTFLYTGAAQGSTPWFDGNNWQFNTNLYNDGGNVGIGTNNPQNTLEVNGGAQIDNGLTVTNTATMNNNLVVNGNSYLNGTATVGQGLTTNGVAYSEYSGTAEIFANGDNHSGGGIAVSDDGGFYDWNDGYITYQGSTGLKIAGSNGNTSSGSLYVQGNLTGTGNVQFQNYTNGFLTVDGSGNLNVANGSGNGFIFNQTNQQGGSNFNIDGTGTVGQLQIGNSGGLSSTTSGYGSISLLNAQNGYYGVLFGQNGTAPNLMFDGNGNGGYWSTATGQWQTYYTAGTQHLNIGTSNDLGATLGVYGTGYFSGDLGLNTNAPTAQLDVNGSVRFENLTNGLLTVDGSGNLSVSNGAGNFIVNGTGQQSGANFNIDGSGTVGTNLQIGNSGNMISTPDNWGSIGLTQNQGGFYGIAFGSSNTSPNWMWDANGNGGMYYPGGVGWDIYWNENNKHFSVGFGGDMGYGFAANGDGYFNGGITAANGDLDVSGNGTISGGTLNLGNSGQMMSTQESWGSISLGQAQSGFYGVAFGPNSNSLNMMFDGNGNGGWYNPAVGNWQLYYTSSNSHFTLGGGGDMGYMLGVPGTGYFNSDLGTGGNLSANGNFNANGTGYVLGNFGVGLSDANAKLVVQQGGTDPGSYSNGKALYVTGNVGSGQSYDGGVEFRHDNNSEGIGFGYNTIYATGYNSSQDLNLIAKGSSNLTLQAYGGATGNVGIATTNPTAMLDVNGSVRFESLTNGLLSVDGNGNLSVTNGGGGSGFWSQNGSSVYNNNGGNIGINTSNPNAALEVNGNTIIDNGLIVNGVQANQYGATPEIWANGDNHTGGGIAISDDGGFYDYNDGWVTYLGSTGLRIAGNNGQGSTGNTLEVDGTFRLINGTQQNGYVLTSDGSGNATWQAPTGLSGANAGDMQYWNGSAWVILPAGTEGQILTVTGGVPAWTAPAVTVFAPTISTTVASAVTPGNATTGGFVSSNGGAAVTAYGVCWGTSSNPTTGGSHTTDGSGTGVFTSNLGGLTPGTTYYVRAYAINSQGTAYGQQITFTTPALGAFFQGGYLAYILQPGDPGYDPNVAHGLIANDGDNADVWNNVSFPTTTATGTAIGTGAANTAAIITAEGSGAYAATDCVNNNAFGYTDWYLPSKDELNKLYLNQAFIPGLQAGPYWSSTDAGSPNAWSQDFSTGVQSAVNQGNNFNIRPIRSF